MTIFCCNGLWKSQRIPPSKVPTRSHRGLGDVLYTQHIQHQISTYVYIYMGVSKNGGTPKWMVYNGKPYKNGWFGSTTIFGNTHMNMNIFEVNFCIHVKASQAFLKVSVPNSSVFFVHVPSRYQSKQRNLAKPHIDIDPFSLEYASGNRITITHLNTKKNRQTRSIFPRNLSQNKQCFFHHQLCIGFDVQQRVLKCEMLILHSYMPRLLRSDSH